MKDLFIHYQNRKTPLPVPPAWKIISFADFGDSPGVNNIREKTRTVLQNPIGKRPLWELVTEQDRVALLIEDLTRPSPKRIILEAILELLEQKGLPDRNITIVFSLGTHRGLAREEIEGAFGKDLVGRYEFVNHDCRAADLVPAGRLKTGQPVRINRRVMEATFRLGVGSIFPHPMNGFGGGGKILFPGMADLEAITDHHFHYTFQSGTGLGKLDGNPFYEEVCALARSVPLHFVVNGVLDQKDALADLVAGDPIEAHRAGAEICRTLTTRRFPKRADLTVTTSFPYKEGPQIVKPLVPASLVTKPGGCIILAADCSGNLPEPFIASFERFRSRHEGDLFGGVLAHFSERRLIMEGGAVDYNMALAFALAAQHHFSIILVSRDIPRRTAERMGYVYAEDLDQAMVLSARCCPSPEVHVIPSGGVILPEIEVP
jgi:nickel-dependent lactate racemase